MPLYEYRCPTCRETFELLRPMRASDKPATCPRGHRGAARTISLFATPSHGNGDGAACACGGSCRCGAR